MPTPNNTEAILDRIQQYLEVGGLWNPELMEHDKVRRLLLDIRTHLFNEQTAKRWKEYETRVNPVDEYRQVF